MTVRQTEENSEFDPALIELCGQGDAAALKKFFDLYAQDIFNFPLKVFHLDEDAASDFFLYAYERLEDGMRFRSFQNRSSFRTWFYTVLRNLVIDWMRTIREVDTVQAKSRTSNGEQEFDLIANTPDPKSLHNDNESLTQFHEYLGRLPLEVRTILKLSYIYYLDLETAELEYLCRRKGCSQSQLLENLMSLRHELSEKELKNIAQEDKITSLYLKTLELKSKREQVEQRVNQQAVTETAQLDELERLQHAIEKKREQRRKLLQKKDRGRFIVRTPYKQVADFVGTSEGNISVQMMRIMERLRDFKVA